MEQKPSRASLLFNISKRALTLLAWFAGPGRNDAVITINEEGARYFLNGKELAYLPHDPRKPIMVLDTLPPELVEQLHQIDILEMKAQGLNPN